MGAGKCLFNSRLRASFGTFRSIFPFSIFKNLKTFTRHSGGKLTTDIVNDVLKDCDVPPVIGARAGNSEWSRVEYDGTFFFHVVS